MATALFYSKIDNTILDVASDVVSLRGNELKLVNGLISGWDQEETGIIISDDIEMYEDVVYHNTNTVEEPHMVEYRVRKVKHGEDILNVGDPIPDIADRTSEFVIVNDMNDRIADIELMLAEILLGGI